jgi:hypothetical protein
MDIVEKSYKGLSRQEVTKFISMTLSYHKRFNRASTPYLTGSRDSHPLFRRYILPCFPASIKNGVLPARIRRILCPLMVSVFGHLEVEASPKRQISRWDRNLDLRLCQVELYPTHFSVSVLSASYIECFYNCMKHKRSGLF